MMQDWEFLSEYIQSGSQAAFGQLVERYVDFVYSVCLREVRDPDLAQDVTQVVFLILTRKARTLRPGTVLAGWLFNTARFASKDALKYEARRHRREQKAAEAMISELHTGKDANWDEIEPLLQDALAGLGAEDRNALLLRFFEGKSLRQTGVALGVSEDAARQRVSRALEKLRRYFSRHGYAVSGLALGGLIATYAVHPAPAACAAAVMKVTSYAAMGATGGAASGGAVTGASGGVVANSAGSSGAFGSAWGSSVASSGLTTEAASVKVLALSEGVLKSMLIGQIKFATVAVLGLSVSGVGVGKIAHLALASSQHEPTVALVSTVRQPNHKTEISKKPRILLAKNNDAKKSDAAPAAREFEVGTGEIELEGRIHAVDGTKKSLLLDVSAFTLPNGKKSELPALKPKSIIIDAQTVLHVRGNAKQFLTLGQLAQIADTVFAVVIGKDLGTGKALPAREVAVWTGIEAGVYQFVNKKDQPKKMESGPTRTTTGQVPPQTAVQQPAHPAVTRNRPITTARPNTVQSPESSTTDNKPIITSSTKSNQANIKVDEIMAPVEDQGRISAEPIEPGFPFGTFEQLDEKGQPLGWHNRDPKHIKILEEDGNHFVRITNLNPRGRATIDGYFKLNPKWKALQIRARLRAKDLKVGAEPWLNGAVGISFTDAQGQHVGGYPDNPSLNRDSDWTVRTIRTDIPKGAVYIKLDTQLLLATGTLDVDDIDIEPLDTIEGNADLALVPALDPLKSAPGNLLPTGDFEQLDAQGRPEGWQITDPTHAKVLTEDGNHFLRLVNATDTASASYTLPLDPTWRKFKVRLRMRATGLRVSPDPHEQPQLRLDFQDAAGNKLGRIQDMPILRQEVDWVLMEQSVNIPAGATEVVIRPQMIHTAGAVDFDDIQITQEKITPLPILASARAINLGGITEDFSNLDANGVPLGWRPNDSQRIKVLTENGRHFLRIISDDIDKQGWLGAGAFFNLDPAWKAVRVQCKMRAKNLKPGAQPWFTGRLGYGFVDAAGEKVGGYPATPQLNQDSDWQTLSMRTEIPEGAAYINIMPQMQNSTGTVDFTDIEIEPVP